MYRYVLKRVRDTIEFGVNVRKSFACQQKPNLNVNQNEKAPEKNSQKNVVKIGFFEPSQHHYYEGFKRRYNCKHPNNCNTFLQALTYSTALIAGFYASQLLCLYRRNQNLERRKCFYFKYLCWKNQLLNRKIQCYQDARHRQFAQVVTKIANCHQSTSGVSTQKFDEAPKKSPTDDDQFKKSTFNFSGVGIFEKRFKTFLHDEDVKQGTRKVYFNVNNDKTKEKTPKKERNNDDVPKENESEKFKAEVFENVSQMIGEVEFQMGIDCIQHGEYEEAAEHFKMSTNSNNASACFNLALLYENGLGVKKDMIMAKRLYQMASDWGNERALYNLGVYFAQGLGGTKKSTRQAKLCFERAAKMGDAHAIEALNMLKSSLRRKLSSEPEDFIEYDHHESDPVLLKSVNYYSNPRHSVAAN